MTSLAVETFGPLHLYEPANDNAPTAGDSPRVIALSGPAGSGKSTAAAFLQDKGYTLVKFAGPLKAMCRAIGMGDEHIEGRLKERPMDWLQGKSPREFMQMLGTEFGRDCIGPHFWVGLWERAALEVMDGGGCVVCDDCRFANEADAVRKLGGIVVRLVGRGGLAGGHASESMDWEADAVLVNTGSQKELRDAVRRIAAWPPKPKPSAYASIAGKASKQEQHGNKFCKMTAKCQLRNVTSR